MSSTITSTGKGTIKNVIQVPKEDMPTHQLQIEESQQGVTSFSAKQTYIKVTATTRSTLIVLRDILCLDKRMVSRHSLNVRSPKAPSR